jgi:hypothetical protein
MTLYKPTEISKILIWGFDPSGVNLKIITLKQVFLT